MKVCEIMDKALRGELRWVDAATILGISDRQMRRWRMRYQADGADGLRDLRKGKQPSNRVSEQTVRQVLELYRSEYQGFNAQHFWEQLVEQHEIKVSYSWVKRLLQETGYLHSRKRRKAYRRRRDRRPMRGMLLHIDGSKHHWFGEDKRAMQDLVLMVDDATGELVDGCLVPEESTLSVLWLLREVVREHGTFAALYTDRASHFVFTPKAGQEPDRRHKTQVARILDDLGIELICAYSPQARGRSERMFRTLQGRLPQELEKAGVDSYEAATSYLRNRFIPRFNRRFAKEPELSGSSFEPVRGCDLDALFSLRYERVVTNDHTIRFQNQVLQLPKPHGLTTYAKRTVQLLVGLDGIVRVRLGARLLATFELQPLDDQAWMEAA